jgi:VanZ family protein
MAPAKNRSFLPAGLFAAVMFLGYSLPAGRLEEFRESGELFNMVFSDFSLHFFVFAVFAFLLMIGFSRRCALKRAGISAGRWALGYGIFIEIWQGILPYREFNYSDLIIDFFGILLGLALFWAAVRFIGKKKINLV